MSKTFNIPERGEFEFSADEVRELVDYIRPLGLFQTDAVPKVQEWIDKSNKEAK